MFVLLWTIHVKCNKPKHLCDFTIILINGWKLTFALTKFHIKQTALSEKKIELRDEYLVEFKYQCSNKPRWTNIKGLLLLIQVQAGFLSFLHRTVQCES